MAELEAQVIDLAAAGQPDASEAARQRLEVARAARATQVADLAMSRRHRDRLANPTPDEVAALDQSDAEVAEKEALLRTARAAHEEATEHWRELSAQARVLDQQENAAYRAARDAEAAAITARDEAVVEAKRLYIDAGVSARFAGFYATDMAEAASRATGNRYGYTQHRNGYGEDPGPQRPLTMKVKRDGPDRDKTMSAKTAAEQDPRFLAANQRLTEAIAHVQQTRATINELSTTHAPTYEARQEAQKAASATKYAAEDAESDHRHALARSHALRARIGSGIGVGPHSTVDMARVGDEIVRNPDGTTNAYVYNEPSDGFPHGRYIAATGITTVHGFSAANALVLENGQKAWQHGHYARTLRGAGETTSGYQKVVLVPAHPQATPLRSEGVATAGFYTFVDSSD